MFSYSKDGIKVSTCIDTRKANAQGTYPVKIQVNYKGVREYFPTGKSLSKRNAKVSRSIEAAPIKTSEMIYKAALKS